MLCSSITELYFDCLKDQQKVDTFIAWLYNSKAKRKQIDLAT